MDEAERCHEIAYIAYGKLMARGSAAEIIAGSGLRAMVVTGPGADRLAPALRDADGITAAAAFGTALHVCSPEAAALKAAMSRVLKAHPGLSAAEAEPTLEDVFIHLMGQATDNAAAA
jgi:ABC-2 type transport system ATP-binding protein